ncbi:MAG: CCA tRNA nucleotidyltransferase [Acidimicrobiia bacterium]|nr:CCA tRNA nucleotidyltransferase [Acidimicrobiia bacterium]
MIPARLQPLLDADGPAMALASRFAGAGHSLYLVGGSLRDLLLDREAEDLDFATDARPDQIKDVVGPWADDMYLMGETFGTIGAVRHGHVYEITTFRSEVYRDESRKPRVTFSNDIETDLSRRDFAVNAMALRLPDGSASEPSMIDPFGGLADLAAATLRTPIDPHVSFGDDPLRMLRLYRFMSSLGFAADPAAETAVREMNDRLAIVSAERIRDEFAKLMVGDHVAEALEALVASGLADRFLPEVPALAMEQDPMHRHKDVLAHTIAVVAKTSPRRVLRMAALFHDVGKPETRDFGAKGVTFHHHEVVGARMTRARMRELRFPKDDIRDVSQLVFLHMRPHTFKMGWTDRAVRRYVRDAGPLLDDLNELVRCDVTTRNEKRARAISRRIDELEERIEVLSAQEELSAIRPPIDGNRVMEHLGMSPGPVVGEAMGMLLEHRLDHGPYSEDEALALLDEWWAQRS